MPILNSIARDLSLTISLAGQLVTGYALGVVSGIILLLVALRHANLKVTLLLAAGFIFMGNLCSALSTDFWMLIAARFLSGLPDGILFATGAIVVSHLTDYEHQARDVTLMVLGQTSACLVGVPIATRLCQTFSWRSLFILVSVLGAIFFVCVLRNIPKIHSKGSGQFLNSFEHLSGYRTWMLLSAIGLGSGAFFAYYSYIDPIMEGIARIDADKMSFIAGFSGLSMVLGNALSALLTRWLSDEALSTIAQAVMGIAFIGAFIGSGASPLAILFMMLAAGSNFFLAGPEQALLIRDAKESELLIAAFGQLSFNLGNALGAYLGGVSITTFGSIRYCLLPALVMGVVSLIFLSVYWHQNMTNKNSSQ